LRGLAALLVALFHVYVYGRWGGLPAQWGVLAHAWLFVDLFFVISGYVMAAAYSDRLRTPAMLGGYMVRRFFRLYPLHLVTTASVILAALAVQTVKWLLASHGIRVGEAAPFAVPFFDLDYLGLELVLMQGLGIVTKEIHNYPAWSISVEFWMYLFFGVSMLLVRTRWLRVLFSVAIVALCLVHFLSAWSSSSAPPTLDVRGLPRGLLSFFLGVLVFHAWSWRTAHGKGRNDHPSAGSRHTPLPGSGLLAGTRGIVLLGLLQSGALLVVLWLVDGQTDLGAWQLAIPFAFALLVLTLLPDRGIVAALLQTGPMQWLGVHSYAIYLTHITVQTLLDWPGRALPEPAKHLVGLVFVAAVLLLSVLAHRLVEVPWRERGKRIAARLVAGAGAPASVGKQPT
jgi:peptidoglycan/LPS O-acetylase OafA/YrhL